MFQISLASAVLAAFTLALLPRLLHAYGLSPSAQACTILLFGFSENYWLQSGGAKGGIYTLGTLFMVGVLYAVERLNADSDDDGRNVNLGMLGALSFLMAAMLTHHWQSMAFGPALAILGYPLLKKFVRSPILLVHAIPSLILGAMPILYLPIRASADVVLNWGKPDSLEALGWTLRREGYKGIGDIRGWETVQRNLSRFWSDLLDQFVLAPEIAGSSWAVLSFFILFVLALAGGVRLTQRNPRVAAGFVVLGFTVAAAVILYSTSKQGYEWVIDNFFTPFYLMAALFAGEGFSWGLGVLGGLIKIRFVRLSGGVLALLLVGGTTAISNLNRCDQRKYLFSYDYGMNLLKSAPKNALIMCAGDIDILPLWYMRYVKKIRQDVTVVTAQLLPYPWYRDAIGREDPRLKMHFGPRLVSMEVVGEALMNQALTYRPVAYTFIFTRPFMKKYPAKVRGSLWHVVSKEEQSKPYDSVEQDRAFNEMVLRGCLDPSVYKDEYTSVLIDSYGTARDSAGYISLGRRDYRTAIHEFHRAIPLRSASAQPTIISNMASAYRYLKDFGAAASHYRQALQLGGKSVALYYNYGKVLMELDNPQKAVPYLRHVARNTRDAGLMRVTLEALKKLGDKEGLREANQYWSALQNKGLVRK